MNTEQEKENLARHPSLTTKKKTNASEWKGFGVLWSLSNRLKHHNCKPRLSPCMIICCLLNNMILHERTDHLKDTTPALKMSLGDLDKLSI